MGSKTYLGAKDASLIAEGSGRLVNMVVSVAGSATGTIHDASSVANATNDNIITIIPMATGIGQINVPFTDGLVIKPGTGQTLSITYS